MIDFDDDEISDRADAMLVRHGMRLVGRITHDAKTHEVRFRVEQIDSPGIHAVVELPIDMFADNFLANDAWLRILEQRVLSVFRDAKPD